MKLKISRFAIAFASMLLLCGCSDNKSINNINTKISQANQYLKEENLDEALILFQEELQNDSDSVDAYMGIIEVYIRQEKFEDALKYAEQADEIIKDADIHKKLEMLQSGNITASDGRIYRTSYYDSNNVLTNWTLNSYDKNKKVIKRTWFNADGTILGSYDILYDDQGRVIHDVTGSLYNGSITGLTSVDYEYDGDNTKPSFKHEYQIKDDSLVFISSTQYEYDENGKTKKITFYNEDKSIKNIRMYEHDSLGNCTKTTNLDSSGSVTNYSVDEYDGNKKKKSTSYDGNDNVTSYEIYEYDESGNRTRSIYNADGTLKSRDVTTGQ